MKLTELAIKNKVTTYFIIFFLLVIGYSAYNRSEKAQDPGFTIKVALITTNWPGATAKQMADLVSKKISNEVQNMDSLWYVNSTNTDGQSNVYVNIKAQYKDIQPIWDELRNRINTFVVPSLPKGVGVPQINTFYGDIYGTLLAVGGNSYSYDELYKTAYRLKETLLFNVPQIGNIEISGVQKQGIYIDINNKLLAKSGISLENIINTLQSSNVIINAGNIVINENRIKINPTGNFNNIDSIKNLIITSSNKKESIYLKEIATVKKEYQTPSNYSTDFNGEKSIILGISLGKGEDVLLMGKGIEKTLKTFRNSIPVGLEVGSIYYLPDLVQTNVTAFIVNLFQAVTTIVLVMLIFLGFRSGLIVAALTPTSIAFTLAGIYYLGYGINQITLAGLIIALGMLVDNAVVMSENIMVLISEGKSKMEACLESSRTLAIPLLVSSLTTITAFSPILLNKQNMGEYVGPLTIVVMLALLGSWLINQTFIPLLCYDFLKVKGNSKQNLNSKSYLLYRKILILVLKNKKITLILTFLSFILGLFLLDIAPKNFMGSSTDPVMSTYITLPKGSDINYTRKVVKDLNGFIKKNYSTGDQKPLPPGLWNYITTGGTNKYYKKQGVLSWGSFVGGGAPRFSTGYSPQSSLPEYAYIMYNLSDYKLIPKLSSEINSYLLEKYPGIDVVSKGLGSGVSLTKDLGYVFSSHNIPLLKKVAEEVKTKLASMDNTYAITDDWGVEVPKIDIDINSEKAQLAGFSSKSIGENLDFVLKGYTASVFRNFNAPPKNTTFPIILRGSEKFKNNINSIESIELINSNGESVPLKQIAKVKLKYEDSLVTTRNMAYSIEVDSAVKAGESALKVNNDLMPWLKAKLKEWGPEIKYYPAGIVQSSQENQDALFEQVPFAILFMFFLVVAQFNSIRKGLCIMLVIPLSVLGVGIGLLVTGTDLGFMAMIGLIALSGVVLNHAIILVDKMTIEKHDMGRDDTDAIVFGCQSRLRPIFLTVATTLVGLLPLYFFGGPLFQPVAVVLISGLVLDTVLALGVIPVIYALFFKIDFTDYEYDEKKL